MNFKNNAKTYENNKCYLCNSTDLELVCQITKKPEKEINFGISEGYHREIYYCKSCGAYNNFHDYDFNKLYSGRYNETTYNNEVPDMFKKIMNLPDGSSDNRLRVKRIIDFCNKNKLNIPGVKVLDVGSGLCVFLAELKKYGFICHCIDPDPISIKHALENVKVDSAYLGTFENYDQDSKFDIITFNKVLEHIKNPVSLLKKAKNYLNDRGFVYIELPDGDSALKNDDILKREEFYAEHYIAFSVSSMRRLIEMANFVCSEIKKIHEPSGKYTLYAFCKKGA